MIVPTYSCLINALVPAAISASEVTPRPLSGAAIICGADNGPG